jgi:broad specificity phosphatase PhoE
VHYQDLLWLDDTELSSAGIQATKELTKHFETIHVEHIVSLPYYRCLQTVAEIAKEKNIPIKIESGICEVEKRRRR